MAAVEAITDALKPGTQIGTYQIIKLVRRDEFAITYRARDTAHDIDVAIKEYLPGFFAMRQDGTSVVSRSSRLMEDFLWGREQFLAEARKLAALAEAPGLVRVTDWMEANGTAYMVSAWIHGELLAVRLARTGSLTPDEVHLMLWPLLEGLARVHEAGLLHLDIKPSSIILDDAGHPTLAEFGAVRAALAARMQSTDVIHTPGYAAIEQFSEGQVGPATDIYAMAATLYHCVTGTVPPPAIARLVVRLPPVSQKVLDAYAPDLLAGINAGLILRSAGRPASVEAWRAMLQGLSPVETPAADTAADGPSGRVGASPAARTARSRRSRGGVGVALVGVLVVAGAVGSGVYVLRSSMHKQGAVLATSESTRATAEAERKAQDEARKAAEARARADADAARQAEAEARRKAAEAETRRLAEERARADAQRQADAEAARRAADEARRLADERARLEAQRQAEAEAARKATEETRRLAEERAREATSRQADAEAARTAEAEARRQAEERAQAEAKRQADAAAVRKAEAEARRLAEERARAEAKRQAEAEAARKAEAEARRLAEERARAEAKRQADAEAARQAEAEARRMAEEHARAVAETRRQAEQEAARAVQDKARAADAARAADDAARAKAAADARRQAEDEARRSAEQKAAADAARQGDVPERGVGLSPRDRRRVHVALTALGLDTQGVDEEFGPRARAMIAAWQKRQGAPETGVLTARQYALLQRQAAAALASYDEEENRINRQRQELADVTPPQDAESPPPAATVPPPADVPPLARRDAPPSTAAAPPVVGAPPRSAGPIPAPTVVIVPPPDAP
ncbi:MAG: protein kinase, partial [Alphaproteobacteria bacterium]|nr:protein kinase [Alphaproteobacteria bacterium]